MSQLVHSLQQIKNQIQPYSSIMVTDLCLSAIQLRMIQIINKTEKRYIIKTDLTSQHNLLQLKALLDCFSCQKLYLREWNKQIFTLLSYQFSQIIIPGSISYQMLIPISKISTNKIIFESMPNPHNFKPIYETIYQKCQAIELHIHHNQILHVEDFFRIWLQFSQNHPQFIVVCESEIMARLEICANEGYLIYLHEKCFLNQSMGLVEKLFSFDRYMSLQFSEYSPGLMKLIDWIFTCSPSNQYLLKIGNQLQITESLLVLNTNGLPHLEILQIFTFMKRPGHYEFICYSNKYYLPQIIELFMTKPLIRCSCQFVEAETDKKLSFLAQKMEESANSLKSRLISFMRICEHLTTTSLDLQQKIFQMMGS